MWGWMTTKRLVKSHGPILERLITLSPSRPDGSPESAAREEEPPRSVLVASVDSRAGRTITALGLAMAAVAPAVVTGLVLVWLLCQARS